MVADTIDRARVWFKSATSYKYKPLTEDGTGHDSPQKRSEPWEGRNRSLLKLTVGGFIVAIALYFMTGYMRASTVDECDSIKNGFQCRPEISHFWGQYSPFYPVHSDINRAAPGTCNITFAQVLSRHGARDPTLDKTITYGAIMTRVQSSVTSYGKGYEFIEHYDYALGADQLTLFGEREMVNSGAHFYKRYEHLASTVSPFVRSSGQYRVVESAQNWTQGFHQARLGDQRTNLADDYPYNILVIPEEDGFNNSLNHQLCTAFEEGPASDVGSNAQEIWRGIFAPPITERLNQNLPGAYLTDHEAISFMDLCPFNTVANLDGKLSPFCRLFTTDEWHDYDYYQSLGKWYGYGSGNPLGATQGVGFVNELIARLTNKAVVDHTSTNSTLDESSETFPLGRALYADFSHDNDMSGVYATLGLYNATEPLSNTTKVAPERTNGFSASWTVPFAARLYVEKMSCEGSDEELVRVLVNNRVIPLRNCGADELGRCKLNSFVDSLSFARGGGHWNACFE